MAKPKVHVNGKSAVHKGDSGKSAATLSPCLNPPTPPAGPVPAPLPNTASAADLDGAAPSVLIDGNPMGHKGSTFATSIGDAAALAPPPFGTVVSHVKDGKAHFTSFSMNVLVEGSGAVSHASITTHDHQEALANTVPWPFLSAMDVAGGGPCEGAPIQCRMTPYDENCGQPPGSKKGKPPEKVITGHHIIPDHCIKNLAPKPGHEPYAHGKAPCICVQGPSWNSTHSVTKQPLSHNVYHRRFDVAEAKAVLKGTGADLSAAAKLGKIKGRSTWTLEEAMKEASRAAEAIDGCKPACIEVQLKNYYEKRCGLSPDQKVECTIERGAIREEARAALAGQAKKVVSNS